ncbi:hypothetical protein ACFSLT_11835 [Novosphingobium resinovorum]
MISGSFSETLPLMLIGMALYRAGLFDGTLRRKRLIEVSLACTFAGMALTVMFLGWAWPRHFPAVAMQAALVWGSPCHTYWAASAMPGCWCSPRPESRRRGSAAA